jgi:hypothetical protein
MVTARIWSTLAVGASLTVSALPAHAQTPGLYYSWRALSGDVATCIDRSITALETQALGNIQVEGNSVGGTTDNATVVFVCLDNTDSVTVMLMVSSTDDDVAFGLRETLKESF